MTYPELVRKLRQEGWTIKNGSCHDQATHANKPGIKISIPRHKGDIPKGTLSNIKKLTGLK
jgi:predicted RNA binding protein YcfA (HicA-like mRNA interferase family)